MALFPSMGARPNDDLSGTSALAVRKALGWLFTGPGVMPGAASPLVAGTSGWSYSVGAAGFVTQRTASDGVHLLGNDGAVTVGATGVGSTVSAAPGTGSRVDVIWVRQRSNGENGDVTSVPDFGVTQGTAGSPGLKPSIPTGALELATAVVSAGNANTAAATITQTAALAGLVQARRTRAWFFTRDSIGGLGTQSPFAAGGYVGVIAQTITNAPAGTYAIWGRTMLTSTTVSAGSIRVLAAGATIDETRADVDAVVRRMAVAEGTHYHAGGNLSVALEVNVSSGSPQVDNGNTTRLNVKYLGA